jgi:hypothetical protein
MWLLKTYKLLLILPNRVHKLLSKTNPRDTLEGLFGFELSEYLDHFYFAFN